MSFSHARTGEGLGTRVSQNSTRRPQGLRWAGLRVPKDLRDITLVWLTEALQSRGAAGGASVTGYSAETLAEGKGFMNRLFRVTLDYDADLPNLPAAMIVKLPSADPLLRAVFDRLGQNRREVRFYQRVGSQPSPAGPSRCYHSGVDPSTGHTVLLLEDMSHARQGDSVAGCSMAEARARHRPAGQIPGVLVGELSLGRLALDAFEGCRSRLLPGDIPSQEIYPGAWKSLIEKAGDGMPPGLRRLGRPTEPGGAQDKGPTYQVPQGRLSTETIASTIASSLTDTRILNRWWFSIGSSACAAGAPATSPPSSARRFPLGNVGRWSWTCCAPTTPSCWTMA